MKKMNVMGGMFKDKKKKGNLRKQFTFVVRSCAHFQSFRVHKIMNAKSVIETTSNSKGKESVKE